MYTSGFSSPFEPVNMFPLFFDFFGISTWQVYQFALVTKYITHAWNWCSYFPLFPVPNKTAEISEAWSQPTACMMMPPALNRKSRWNRVWETSGLPWCYCWGGPISEVLTLYWNSAMSHHYIYQAQNLSPMNLSRQQMPCPCSHLLAVVLTLPVLSCV